MARSLAGRAFTRAKGKRAIRSGFAEWRFAFQRTARHRPEGPGCAVMTFELTFVPSAAAFENHSSRLWFAKGSKSKELLAQWLRRRFWEAVPTRRYSPPAEKWAVCIGVGPRSQAKKPSIYRHFEDFIDAASRSGRGCGPVPKAQVLVSNYRKTTP